MEEVKGLTQVNWVQSNDGSTIRYEEQDQLYEVELNKPYNDQQQLSPLEFIDKSSGKTMSHSNKVSSLFNERNIVVSYGKFYFDSAFKAKKIFLSKIEEIQKLLKNQSRGIVVDYAKQIVPVVASFQSIDEVLLLAYAAPTTPSMLMKLSNLSIPAIGYTAFAVSEITCNSYKYYKGIISYGTFKKKMAISALVALGGYGCFSLSGFVGAAIGSFIPVIGTVIGSIVGSIVGGLSGSLLLKWLLEKLFSIKDCEIDDIKSLEYKNALKLFGCDEVDPINEIENKKRIFLSLYHPDKHRGKPIEEERECSIKFVEGMAAWGIIEAFNHRLEKQKKEKSLALSLATQ
eukprot:TRINITY_DN6062_c0_g2_i1.p1 TRINITY_DN6062_c0_g2~~TRINITY_DN6062_c0_g2_i1.p1  ORF type:complete len:345 (+),score=62.55 TRINITY_DN6062_c0_g2_i1:590-1624(+)